MSERQETYTEILASGIDALDRRNDEESMTLRRQNQATRATWFVINELRTYPFFDRWFSRTSEISRDIMFSELQYIIEDETK